MNTPRPEYPRPQLVRKDWLNLNGEWDFEIDNECSGEAKGYPTRESFSSKIIVPFCPESSLSGIGNKDFMNCVWYRKALDIPAEWAGKRVLLHFGAVDYRAKVFVNGKFCKEHRGGYTPFYADITELLTEEGNYVTVCAYDDLRSGNQPGGKQSSLYASHGCSYTRTTGIWQTVWLEAVSDKYIESFKAVGDIETVSVNLEIKLNKYVTGVKISAVATFDGKVVGSGSTVLNSFSANINIPLSEKHLWDIGQGNLYDLKLTVEDGDELKDTVDAYFGLRSVAITDKSFLLNGRRVYGRWVLDQGFYPDGIYTAPSDDALKFDIEASMQLGFNGARLHEKIFEPRFLYWADKLGYLVWGEHANWGMNTWDIGTISGFLPEFLESMERDFSHPSLIGWCPFNETWDCQGRQQSNDLLRVVYLAVKAADPTRPVIDTSGNFHVVTDIFDIHEYEQDSKRFKELMGGFPVDKFRNRQKYEGQPWFLSEYGGIKWDVDSGEANAWGYGNAPKTEEEFLTRYKELTTILLENPYFMGFCYTQLYDVEQETNGLMTYDRKFKFDPKIFYDINTQKAANED